MRSSRTWAATSSPATEPPAVNILLVGLGRWGEKHLRVLGELGVTLWAADVSAARREWAVRHGLEPRRALADYREALSHVGAADLVTSADSHHAVARECLAAGLHCFVEKPLARTAAEGRDLEAAAAAAGRLVQVGHIFRFHPVTATLRDALESGRIGRVRYAAGRFAGFKRPRADVGVTHAIVEANYFAPGPWRDCVIVGERGALVADYGSSVVTLHLGTHLKRGDAGEAVETGKEELPTRRDEPLRLELQAFQGGGSR